MDYHLEGTYDYGYQQGTLLIGKLEAGHALPSSITGMFISVLEELPRTSEGVWSTGSRALIIIVFGLHGILVS